MIGKCAYAIRRASMVLYGHVTDRCPCSSPSYFVNKMMMKHPFWQSMLMRVFLYMHGLVHAMEICVVTV